MATQQAPPRQVCFVIMPFSKTTEHHTEDYWTRHYENFLKPLIENEHLEARRSKALRGDILREIVTHLVSTSLVVADLTDANPNVYWELGVRQSFKHGSVTIAEEGTKLPFDLGLKGTLFYPNDRLKWEEFRKVFFEALKDCLAHPDRPDSHVLETISGRGTLFEIFRRDEALRRLDGLSSEFERNRIVLTEFKRVHKINLGRNERPHVTPSERFMLPAIELLLTNRYIDESKELFQVAQNYYSGLVAFNGMVSDWGRDPKGTAGWLKKEFPRLEEIIVEFSEMLASARKAVENRI